MGIFQKMKRDKAYRVKVVLLLVGFLILIGNTGEPKEAKKQYESFSTCNSINTMFSLGDQFWLWDDSSVHHGTVTGNTVQQTQCTLAECYIGQIPAAWALDQKVCVPYVPNGWVVPEGHGQDPDKACHSGCVENIGGEYHCRACEDNEEPETCNAAMQAVADMVNDLFDSNMRCKSAFYAVVFGGGMLALILFAAL